METNNPVSSNKYDQHPQHVIPALATNSVQRPSVPFWGQPPPFRPPPVGPRGWLPHPPPVGFFRFGPGLRPPQGIFSSPPPPVSTVSFISASSGANPLNVSDQIWLQSWIQRKSLGKNKEKPSKDKKVNISEARQKLKKCVLQLKRLKLERETLFSNYSRFSHEEWKKRWSDIELMISNVTNFLNILAKPEYLLSLKANLTKRSKKRARLRQQLAMQKLESHQRQILRQQLHHQADAWLLDMQLSVERARRDENLKLEADTVLSEVTRRQSDGRRQIALLEALQKLRQARMQALKSQGGVLSNEQKKQSEESKIIIERLISLWSKQMDVYSMEEHGLRVMLEESAAKQSDIEMQKVSSTLKQWEICLFGSNCDSESGEPENMEMLVAVRHAWDQYLVPDDAVVPMASTIPVGWVLPTTPSSNAWLKVLA